MAKILTSREIGLRLKQLRELAGISQEMMSEFIGVSRGQLQKYESGKNMMNTEKLQLAAAALSVPVQELFVSKNDSEISPLSVYEKTLIDAYRKISNKRLKASILTITLNASNGL
ncbi:MAG: helix-turn-helix domain-containing protein [Desulfobacter sp.]